MNDDNTITEIHTFDTLDALVARCLTAPPSPLWTAHRELSSSTANHGVDWTLDVNTPIDAAALACGGWPEGRRKVSTIITDIESGHRVQGRSCVWTLSPAGHFPDVGAYATGSPFCMHTLTDGGRDIPTTVHRLTVSISASYRCKAPALVRWGAAVCAVIRDIEMRGDSVELILGMDAEKHRRTDDGAWEIQQHITRVRLKSAGQPLDLDAITFALAHPAMLRRLGFCLIEQSDMCGAGPWSSYGRPTHAHTDADGIVLTNQAFNGDSPQLALEKVQTEYQTQLLAKGDNNNV